MGDQLVSILDGNTFVVSDDRGDIEPSTSTPTGLFSFDTRFLSRWVLSVDDQRLLALSTDDLQYFEALFFLVPGTGTVYIDSRVTVIRERAVGDGFHEELTILNHDGSPVSLRVRVEAAADFADLFEVKDALAKRGIYETRVDDGRLVIAYTRGSFRRETTITTSMPAGIDDSGLTFDVTVGAHDSWTTDLDVITSHIGAGQRRLAEPKHHRGVKHARPN